MAEFPPNSFTSKDEPDPAEKKISQVTSEPAQRRKKPLGKRFSGLFFGGDAKSAGQYVVWDVMIPAAKDTIVEAGSQMIERLIFGDSRRGRRGMVPPPSGPLGYTAYNRMSPNQAQPLRPSMSRRARSTHDFDEIILNSRMEGESVIEQLFEIISRYDVASVADLYATVGIEAAHTDNKWGWTDIRGATVSRVRGGGYLLDLPEPKPL